VLALNPGSKEVYHKAGIIYVKEGKFAEACKAFKPAFESDPSNTELAQVYIDALNKAGKEVEAEQVIRKLLAADPDNAGFREKLYLLYLSKKDYDKAIVEASTLADGKIKNEDAGGAEEIYSAFVARVPDFPPGRQKLAEFYISVNRPQDAARELMQAAALFAKEKDIQSARAVLTQAIEVAPDLSEARERLEQLRTPGRAAATQAPEIMPAEEKPELTVPSPLLTEPETVLEATAPAPPAAPAPVSMDDDPAIAEAFIEADVLIKYGLVSKAIEQLESLTSKFPESPRIRTRLRDLYHEEGNIDKSVRHALLAVALYAKFGRDDLSAAALQTARELAPDHPAVLSRLGRVPAAPVAIPPEEIIPDHLEIPLLEPEIITPAPEEIISAETITPGEPAQSGEIEFEELGTVPGAPEPEAIFQSEILQDQLETPVTEFETAPPPPEESPTKTVPPWEPPSTGEIEFEGLDTSLPPQGEAPAEEPSVADLSAREQPSDEEELAVDREQAAHAPVAEAIMPGPAAGIDLDEIWAEAEFYFQQGLFDEAKKNYSQLLALNPSNQRAMDRLSEISREEDETQEFSKLTDAIEGLEGYIPPEATEGALAISTSDNEAVRSLMQQIQQFRQQPAAPAPPPQAPVEASRPVEPIKKADEEARALKQQTRQPKQQPAAPPPPPEEKKVVAPPPQAPVKASKPVKPIKKAEEEDFFDLGEALQREETASPVVPQAVKVSNDTSKVTFKQPAEVAAEDFFDLAAELRDELTSIQVPVRPAAPAEEQSLDDIFEEFKKGVEQQSVKEDADTHYNLGVAYKEMGLLDDAIGEFIMTPVDEPKFIQSRYMLGLCYMEKGEYQNAISEIQNALDNAVTLGIDPEHRIAMHYDLGLAFQGSGNISSAIIEFQTVVNEKPKYRDTAAKLKELRKGDFISFEQLKDDIEKEISSKFFEEGERIEREEKTKKNERVRN